MSEEVQPVDDVPKEEEKQEENVESVDSPGVASTELIDKAELAAKRIEDANAQFDALLKKQEKLAIERRLAGHANASLQPEEETPAEYAKRVMRNEL